MNTNWNSTLFRSNTAVLGSVGLQYSHLVGDCFDSLGLWISVCPVLKVMVRVMVSILNQSHETAVS